MKPFVVVLALAFGLGLVSVAVAIQLNPLGFASVPRTASAIPIPSVRVRTGTTTSSRVFTLSRRIQLEEVLVVGEAKPRRAPPRRSAAVSETLIHVAPAPCVDGAYRKLEAKRGVRLTCPATL
jgi:hypothetical protein